MSQRLINRSPDLKRLRDEGYDIAIEAGYLLVRDVPYVNAKREVKRGTLVSQLSLAGDATTKPRSHVAHFAGEHPCHSGGSEIEQIKHQSARKTLTPNLTTDHSFSAKPSGGYTDYHHKMTTYIGIVAGPAQALDPAVNAQTFPVVSMAEEEGVHVYLDTATSRAGIGVLAEKLHRDRVAIIGLGGTGSYILDLVAKTSVREIHLFDNDVFSQHNAFRSPGAASIDQLRAKPTKVAYLAELYSAMRRNIVPHEAHVDDSTIHELAEMDFVFLALDESPAKGAIITYLEESGVPFIDVGIGVDVRDGGLGGQVRITTSTPAKREHVRTRNRIPFNEGGEPDAYRENIQIADLNALNAALAVIKWKKHRGFYEDLEQEHHSVYAIDGNVLHNDDRP